MARGLNIHLEMIKGFIHRANVCGGGYFSLPKLRYRGNPLDKQYVGMQILCQLMEVLGERREREFHPPIDVVD